MRRILVTGMGGILSAAVIACLHANAVVAQSVQSYFAENKPYYEVVLVGRPTSSVKQMKQAVQCHYDFWMCHNQSLTRYSSRQLASNVQPRPWPNEWG